MSNMRRYVAVFGLALLAGETVRADRAYFQRSTTVFPLTLGEAARDASILPDIGLVVGGIVVANTDSNMNIVRFDSRGSRLWTREFTSDSPEFVTSVWADATGRVYLGGITAGRLGDFSFGEWDFVSARLDADGSVDWLRQYGTRRADIFYSLCVAANGNLYYAGYTQGEIGTPNPQQRFDAVTMRQNPESGVFQWTRILGDPTTSEIAHDVACGAIGQVSITGIAGTGSSPGSLFVARYGQTGNLMWYQQLDGYSSTGESLTLDDDDNVYVTGRSYDGVNASEQMVVARFDGTGVLNWSTTYGDDAVIDYGQKIVVDIDGSVFVAGRTLGSLGNENQGDYDAFLSKHSTDGTLLWVQTFGDASSNSIRDLYLDQLGEVYVAWTHQGGVSVTRFSAVVPEPSSSLQLLVALLVSALLAVVSRCQMRSLVVPPFPDRSISNRQSNLPAE